MDLFNFSHSGNQKIEVKVFQPDLIFCFIFHEDFEKRERVWWMTVTKREHFSPNLPAFQDFNGSEKMTLAMTEEIKFGINDCISDSCLLSTFSRQPPLRRLTKYCLYKNIFLILTHMC